MRVTELHIYPLKSGRGLPLAHSPVLVEGLPGDRRAMLVDPAGRFVTQRELPAIATLSARHAEDGLRLTQAAGGEMLALPTQARMDVTVWRSTVSAALAADAVNATLSDWLGRDVRLAFLDAASRRTANLDWTGNETPLTFADGYQILVTTTASLAALNLDMAEHGEGHVGMERFRPNIVLDTDEAWAEDRWATIEIAGISLDLVKPCARCIMTTQDQETGSRDGPSPLPALGRLRLSADARVPGPLFGWNVTPRGQGIIAIGDTARIVKTRPQGLALRTRTPTSNSG